MSISREGTLSRQYAPRTREDEGPGEAQGSLGRSGSGGRTPPPRIRSGKMMAVKVKMLDDSITLFQVQVKAPGKILFDQVCKQLNLLEVDYFGLEYQDQFGVTYWMDVEKQMNHQIALTSMEPLFLFCVKFYTPDPAQIEEEYTRYLFSLQIKRDLATGFLQCNDNTAALMASYIVQAECGDYVVEDYPDHTYLSSFKFVPQQDADLEKRIMENHKKHIGQSPAEADLNLLETARRCELYGTKMHTAKDHEGMPLNLAVAHMGVVVFQNYTKINTFSWAKIRKLSFKRKRYIIKLHPEGYGYYRDTVEFYFEDRNQCKNFWKKCVEHHGFFRCTSSGIRAKDRERRRIIPRGSSFRYSGKTQKEMQEFVRENFVKRQSFQRNARHLHSSMGNVSSSLSAQPLLPLGDALAASDGHLSSTGPRHLPPQRGRGGSLIVPPPVLLPNVGELRLDPLNFDFKEEENDDEDEDLLRRGIVGSGIVHPDYGAIPNEPQPVYQVVGNLYSSLKKTKNFPPRSSHDQEEIDDEAEGCSDEEERCLSSEDNLSHDSYDLIDKEEEGKATRDLNLPPSASSINHHPTSVASLPNTLLRTDKQLLEKDFQQARRQKISSIRNNTVATLPHSYRSDDNNKKIKERSSPEGIVIYDDFDEDPQILRYFSLPRNNYDTYFVQQPVNPTLSRYFLNESIAPKTLPRGRGKDAKASSDASLKNGCTPLTISSSRLKECSSGSSSSHASPRVARPQSLDFAASTGESSFLRNNSNNNSGMNNNLDEDSSSAVSGMCPLTNLQPGTRHPNILEYNYASSSDVPQTPEGANPFRRDYQDEIIYDVPEGIEGVDSPFIVTRSKPHSNSRVVSFAPLNKIHKINQPVPPPRNEVIGAPYPKLRTQLSLVRPPGLRSESSTEKPPPIIATPTNRNLLPMSSTESESISARSAPILAKNNKLLPSPPEESESSLTVLDSESVPAPPEFASLENPAKQPEDTDVDEEDGAIFSVQSILEEPIIHNDSAILEGILEEDEVYEVAFDGEIELEIVDAATSEIIRVDAVGKEEDFPSQTLSAPPAIGSANKKRSSHSDSSSSTKDGTSESPLKLAQMYVRLGNGSTDNDDSSGIPNIEDEVVSDVIHVERSGGSPFFPDASEFMPPGSPNMMIDLPSPPLAPSATILIASSHPPPPQLSFEDDEVTTEAVTTILEQQHPPCLSSSPTTSEIDLSIIPPPLEEPLCTSFMLERGDSFSPYQPRALSRISERSSFEKEEEEGEVTPRAETSHISEDGNFPSPPSSLQIPASSSVKEDSLILEITPPDFDLSQGGEISSNQDSLPLTAPVSSEVPGDEEDSLHHSMEILEDVNTEDHFEELRHEDNDEELLSPDPQISEEVVL